MTADLTYAPGRVPAGYAAAPISAEDALASLRLCALLKIKPDPVAGRLVVLRDMTDARVFLGCVADAAGYIHEWIELWVQDPTGLAESVPAAREALNNKALDERWRRLMAAADGLDRPLTIRTGWETTRPRPTLLAAGGGGGGGAGAGGHPVHPTDKESGQPWVLCEDDAALAKAGLPPYSSSLHRYLYLKELGGESPFVSVTAGAPTTKATRPLTDLTGKGDGDGALEPFNPGGGFMTARRIGPVSLERYLDLLGGDKWKNLLHGKSPVELGIAVTSGVPEESANPLDEGGLFLGQQGRWGRLIEAFHLKVRAVADAVWQVRETTRLAGRPLLNVGAASFAVRMGEGAPGLPLFWQTRITLRDPGDAVALPIPGSDRSFFVAAHDRGASVYRPESATVPTRGVGTVRIREFLTDRGEEAVVEGTLVSDERLSASKSDLVWLRLNLTSGRLDLFARPDQEKAMASGEVRFRSLPQRVPPAASAALKAAAGVPMPNVAFEIVPMLSTPCDLYSLGVLAVRALLVDGESPLPVALDETLSLARQCAADADGGSSLEDRIEAVFSRDRRYLESLGPHRLTVENIQPEEALDLIPAEVWWRTLATIVRMFPGIGPDSACRDLGHAPPGGAHLVFDTAAANLADLLRRTRSLIVIDWKYNREIHAVIRRYMVSAAGR